MFLRKQRSCDRVDVGGKAITVLNVKLIQRLPDRVEPGAIRTQDKHVLLDNVTKKKNCFHIII
jgi:hypothetical protein